MQPAVRPWFAIGLLLVGACSGFDTTAQNTQPSQGGKADGPGGPTLGCGARTGGSFTSGGMLAAWNGHWSDDYVITPAVRGQIVTVSYSAQYAADYGEQLQVFDSSGAPVAGASNPSGTHAIVRFPALDGWYRLTVKPYQMSAYIYDWDNDPHEYRWVSIENSGGGDYSLRVACSYCQANGVPGVCIDASECIDIVTPYLCPGLANIQCCTAPD
jgi:hypothetical protein